MPRAGTEIERVIRRAVNISACPEVTDSAGIFAPQPLKNPKTDEKAERNHSFAAHNLEGFLECSNATFLDLRDLEEPLPKSQDDEELRLLRNNDFEHERNWLRTFKQKGLSVIEIPNNASLQEQHHRLPLSWGTYQKHPFFSDTSNPAGRACLLPHVDAEMVL